MHNIKHFPKVTIGIISKNRAEILPKAINSALTQSYPNKEVVVLDDCSTDNTRDLCAEYSAVKWILEDEPNGIALGRNKLMQQSDGDFFCSLDDDAWFLENNELEIAIDYLLANPDVAAIAFDILSPDQPTTRAVTEPRETNIYIGCGHILRLSIVKEVGYYHVFPGFYGGEEKDLCIRLIDKGYKIYKLPGVHIWHDKTLVARDLPKQHRSGVFNDLVFTYRCTPVLYLPLAIVNKFYNHFKFSFGYQKANLLMPCLNAFKDFIKFYFQSKIEREAVSIKTFKKYYSLNKK